MHDRELLAHMVSEADSYRSTAPVNAMSVDVEDYFQVSAFERFVPRHEWNTRPHRVEANTRRIMDIFDENSVSATFFVLGWVAERYPELIRDMVRRGNEVASHGYSHIRVTQQSPAQFREDVSRTKKLLEDISGCEILGYRAPSYSIGEKNIWALDVLGEEGYVYSSSIYPIRHDIYGMPAAPRFPFRYGETRILEIPITTFELNGRKFPCGGGGYFRLQPYVFSRWAMRRVNKEDGQSCIFYFHPWEIDVEQPRIEKIPYKTRFRHYLNLRHMEGRLRSLLADFSWNRVDRVFGLREELSGG